MGTIVQDKYDKGCFYVDGTTWQVGTRYTLLKVLGEGSFSCVVAALDNDTGEKVALKRINDVLNNAENAKRVLREVCILRRLSHPHIISLRDVFLKPSSTGRYMYKGGKLVATSLDLYLALEYCDQGDLFHMRGQLSEAEVKVIMLQLLSAVQYLHRNGVWHRDIKSANILTTYTGGQRHIKLADLGSARSVLLEQRLRGADRHAAGAPLSRHHHHHQHANALLDKHFQQLQEPQNTRCSSEGAAQQQQQQNQQQQGVGLAEGSVSQATQTSASLGGAAGMDGALQQQQQGMDGVTGQQEGRQAYNSMHRHHDSMDSVKSGDAFGQQQQLQGNGSAEQQQQLRQGSGSSRAVSFLSPSQQKPPVPPVPQQQQQPQQQPSPQQQQQKRGRLAPAGPPVHHSDSFLADAHSSPSDIYARPVAGGGGGFKAPLTRMVCTPCYRAPEVVMSRGGYTESIDMWGCGCVFGELLQRVAWIGKATTPQLQVAPVFAIHGIPMTPTSGERFDGPGNSVTRTELAALFAVIGTPSWRCIESVANPAWRRYLRKITGRAPTLFRRFGSAGEVAVDLLARLLSFDPIRRCSSEEAIAHEYFEDIRKEANSSSANLGALLVLSSSDLALQDSSGVAATAAAAGGGDGGGSSDDVAEALDAEIQRQQHEDEQMEDWEAFVVPGGSEEVIEAARQQQQHSLSSKQQQQQWQQQPNVVLKRPRIHSQGADAPGLGPFAAAAEAMEEDETLQQPAALLPPLPPAKGPGGASSSTSSQQQQRAEGGGSVVEKPSFGVTPSGQHYYELDDPAAALAALEHDMAALMTEVVEEDTDVAPGGPPPQAPQPLRELLEREVAEHISHLEKRRKELAASNAHGGAGGVTPSPPTSPLLTPMLKRHTPAQPNSIRNQWQHLQPDPGPTMDPSRVGYQRLPHHADAEQAHLDPQQHLRAGRHGEWMADTLQAASSRSAGNVWGVSLVPTGYGSEEAHPELAAIIRHQNKR